MALSLRRIMTRWFWFATSTFPACANIIWSLSLARFVQWCSALFFPPPAPDHLATYSILSTLFADCHSVHPKQARFGHLKTRTHRRDIQSTPSGPGAPYEADCSLRTGGYQTTWGRSRHGGYVRPVSTPLIAAAMSLMCPRPTSYAPPLLSHPFLPVPV